MEHTYDSLHAMTAAQLRELGHGLDRPELKGIATMHKDKLLPLLCTVLGIDPHPHRVAVGIDKTKIKQEIRALKVKRDAAMNSKDAAQLREIRNKIHHMKRLLRKSMVQVG